jgi:hypothetical protein
VEGSEEPCLLQEWRLCAWIEGNLELFLSLFIVLGFVRVLTDMINLISVVDESYNVPLLSVKMQFVSIYDDKLLM